MRLRGLTRALVVARPLGGAVADRALAATGTGRALVALSRRSLVTAIPAAGQRSAPSLRAVSFVVLVLMPVAVGTAYYFAVAADQYVAEFRFTLNTAEPPRSDPLSLLAGSTTNAAAALESQILVQYITSRAILDRIDTSLDVRRLFSTPDADWWVRLPPLAPIEQVVAYWKGQVDPFYEPTNGTVTVRVRAFAAEDALRLSEAIVSACEKLVNDLSSRARRDALQQAESELARAEVRLKGALGDIRAFRDREGLIDPAKTAEATGALTARVRAELLHANAELSVLRSYMRDDAAAVRTLKTRIKTLEVQQRSLAHEMTGEDRTQTNTLSRALGTYEQLQTEQKFAETAYQHAMQALDQARTNADRQRVFVASFVPPSLPEEPSYPRRWRAVGTIALLSFALWGIGGLTVQSIRDHVA